MEVLQRVSLCGLNVLASRLAGKERMSRCRTLYFNWVLSEELYAYLLSFF